jgi:hypothetical protein
LAQESLEIDPIHLSERPTNPNTMEQLTDLHPVPYVLLLCAVLFIARYVGLWYWRINEVVSLLEEQNRLLRKLTNEPEPAVDAPLHDNKETGIRANDPRGTQKMVNDLSGQGDATSDQQKGKAPTPPSETNTRAVVILVVCMVILMILLSWSNW